MSMPAKILIAIAMAVAGFAAGVKWHVGLDAQRELEAQQEREAEAREQFRALDQAAGQHAAALDRLNTQLGKANAQIARLSGRECLDPDTVGVLNATGVLERPAAAVDAASAPAAAASGAGERSSTDVDVAGYIALCRTRYAQLADQLNQILDREDRRHPLDSSTTERKP